MARSRPPGRAVESGHRNRKKAAVLKKLIVLALLGAIVFAVVRMVSEEA